MNAYPEMAAAGRVAMDVNPAAPKVPEVVERGKSLRQAIDHAEDLVISLLDRLEPSVMAGGAFTANSKAMQNSVGPATTSSQNLLPPRYTTGIGEQLWSMEARVRNLIDRLETASKRLEL